MVLSNAEREEEVKLLPLLYSKLILKNYMPLTYGIKSQDKWWSLVGVRGGFWGAGDVLCLHLGAGFTSMFRLWKFIKMHI